ncbi:DNA glycosylase AlkZ-like family protein [Amycolatopsis suaedae]|uniref:Winged helix DNA-binding domain-containing protein n=1 Tax=Amycolatopsis suaedae TaxID=2510978 RepID=A0A4Q7J8C0_9PSEU|nr:crosslink repair DNA glycosylase YcaQ family protein [Amycolatopsis suaedae]RZQ62623.1 winged helix DNA-binding domain-containing protein [Amycolatopsis suaedae]
MLTVDRAQVLAYRIAEHGLHRAGTDPAALAVFDLGVQDNQRGGPALALTARLPEPVLGQALADDPRFVLAWTHRGAPHLHRAADLPGVVAGLVPLSEDDARARLLWQRSQAGATDALATAAKALREVVTAPMTKGAASTEVTARIPPELSGWCRGCGATHISEQLMRVAAPHAGLRLVPGATPATLAPAGHRPDLEPDPVAATAIVAAYLRLHGPAGQTEAAGFVGTTRQELGAMWPDGLAEVRVDGKRRYLPADRLDALENPPEPDLVRLLPPQDPLLQAKDRALLVPDRGFRKEIWRILGNPGAVLADGELAGTWRAKASGQRLGFQITPLWSVPKRVRAAVEEEAARVAAARGYADVRVSWPSSASA